MQAAIVDSGVLNFDAAAWDDSRGTDDAGSFFKKLGRGLGRFAKGVIKAHTALARGIVKAHVGAFKGVRAGMGAAARLAGKVPLIGGVLAAPLALQSSLMHGDAKGALAAGRSILHTAANVASFVPGIGQTIAPALHAADALAQGKPITDALIAAARGAVPGGPVAQEAFAAGVAAVKAAASGQNVGKALSAAAIDAIRRRIPGGPAAKAAFDTAVAIARGQQIQKAVMGSAVSLAGQALGQTGAANALNALSKGVAANMPIGKIADAVRAVALDPKARTIANQLLSVPALRSQTVDQLAQRFGQNPNVIREAMASVAQAANSIGNGGTSMLGKSVIAPALSAGDSLDSALARFGSNAAPPHLGPGAIHWRRRRRVRRHLSPAAIAAIRSRVPEGINAIRAANAMGLDDASGIDRASVAYRKWVQQSLNQVQGSRLVVDGILGPASRAAITTFQKSKGLTADGIVGPQTEAALVRAGAPLPPGADTPTSAPIAPAPSASPAFPSPTPAAPVAAAPTGISRNSPEYIRWYQASLNQVAQAGLVVDGLIGPKTRAAVTAFQKSKGLTADGIVGPQTEAALVRAGAAPPPGSSGAVATSSGSNVVTLPEVTVFGTPPAATAAPGFSRAEIVRAQTLLATWAAETRPRLGVAFGAANITGALDATTRAALSAFQRDGSSHPAIALRIDGELDAPTFQTLQDFAATLANAIAADPTRAPGTGPIVVATPTAPAPIAFPTSTPSAPATAPAQSSGGGGIGVLAALGLAAALAMG